jgi:putative salt-induced outer membrane protein YdiY
VRAWIVILIVLGAATMPLRAGDIVLSSGELLKGRVIEQTPEVLRLDHAILGELRIPLSDVKSIDGKPVQVLPKAGAEATDETARSAETDEQQVKPTETADDQPLTGPGEPPAPRGPDWDARIELGALAREGNTEEANVRAAMTVTRTVPGNVLKLDAGYRFTSSRGDRTENRFTTGVFSEWRRGESPLSAFAQGRFDHAEFQSWDRRLTGSGGLGYRVIDLKRFDEAGRPSDLFSLTGRAGAGARREYGSQNEDTIPEGSLGLEFGYAITPEQRLAGASTLYPDLSDSSEFRLVSALDWTIDLNHLDGISLKLGLTNEYESRTDPGIRHSDLSAFASFVVDF